jgi:dephospho-CoA kinase
MKARGETLSKLAIDGFKRGNKKERGAKPLLNTPLSLVGFLTLTACLPQDRLISVMKVIGLTGGIGSGKSTVAAFLDELGAVVIDADRVGHEALNPGTEAWRRVLATFGRQILSPDGAIDRSQLGGIVFGNPGALSKLNSIMHPPIGEMVAARLEQYRQQGVAVVVIDAPLLIEAGWTSLVDRVWVTVAPEATILKRLEKMGLSPAESGARLRSQLSGQERVKHAGTVINTDLPLDELKARVAELWREL